MGWRLIERVGVIRRIARTGRLRRGQELRVDVLDEQIDVPRRPRRQLDGPGVVVAAQEPEALPVDRPGG
jgi:hypothetical protein